LNQIKAILKIPLKFLWYVRQFSKSHPIFLLKLKLKQKKKFGLHFFQDHFHCLGLYSRRFGYFAQNGQDYFLDKELFHGKQNGFFVDIGTFSPDFDNATYFFEHNKNWSGVAIEPQEKHVQAWRKIRKTPIVHAAASSHSGVEDFVVVEHPSVMNYNAWSGLQTSLAEEKLRQLPTETKRSVVPVQTVLVSTVLDQYLKADQVVDFLSIDVEGHEMDVLNGIDFERHKIKCVVIENDILPEGDVIIQNFLIKKGYKYIARLTSDDVFVRVI
jgi:FkbM family methyltransferase